ncbi:MAG TPA: Clp1/GlmU family protein [Microvirga sp.]|nr:Clp1/GlmU family protein [Microvirga sp.]
MPDDRDTAADAAAAWRSAAAAIVRGGARRVLVLGPRDAGKSTFCRLLILSGHGAGRAMALLDTDVGQKMIGPPACVTLGEPAPDGTLALSALAFVGTSDPVRGWRPLLSAVERLADVPRADLLVVNTGGLLSGPGPRLKAQKAALLAPDIVVAIGRDPGVDAVLGECPDLPLIRLPSSPLARRKAEGERRAARREAFRTYFAGAREQAMSFGSLCVDDGPPPVAAARLLVGLCDASGRDLGLGLLTALEQDAGAFTCLTPVSLQSVSRMRVGALVLDQDFSERPV